MKGHKEMKRRAKGGGVKEEKYTPEDNVEREAEERKKGGRVEKEEKRKERKHGGKVEGEKPKHKMDRPGRKDGGRVGADKSPFSSAHHTSEPVGHKTDD